MVHVVIDVSLKYVTYPDTNILLVLSMPYKSYFELLNASTLQPKLQVVKCPHIQSLLY